MKYSVILDCYTDEPSGYGVRPYLGTHQIHLSHALEAIGERHYYLTIDDLRVCNEESLTEGGNTNIATLNTTLNCSRALDILNGSHTIYIVMGCFVHYSYFSCMPPICEEVARYLKSNKSKKVLFYVMGTLDGISPDYAKSSLAPLIDLVEHGNTYRLVVEKRGSGSGVNLINPNYPLLDRISSIPPPLLAQLKDPIIAEIETGTGCNTPTCRFCIESARSPKVTYRKPVAIINQVRALYSVGVRHFRLGRQPNFFHYQYQDLKQMQQLLAGIREACPDIRTLHIDNVNIVNVITPAGREIARMVAKYCSSGNVAPFGIESFDPVVRKATRIAGTADQVIAAIEIINEFGAGRGSNGIPILLPGVNIIHNLPGHRPETHEINLKFLAKILDKGLMTYRLFFRNQTQATGVSFGASPQNTTDFTKAFDDIVNYFVIPMQDRVYPRGTIMRDDFEFIRRSEKTFGRALGSCSIKLQVNSNTHYDRFMHSAAFRVIRSNGYRELEVNSVDD